MNAILSHAPAATVGPPPSPASLSPHRRLADRLAREFGGPVGLVDLQAVAWVERLGVSAEAFPDPNECRPAPNLTSAFLIRGSGIVWLAFHAGPPHDRSILALVGFNALSSPPRPGWGPPCPDVALLAWGEAVADRLRRESGSRLTLIDPADRRHAPGAYLLDDLIRRLRVSDPPERFQRIGVRAVREAIGALAVAWVPGSSREPVVLDGGVSGLTPDDYRDLVLDATGESIQLRVQELATGSHPVAIAAADRENASGWLVAIGTREGDDFRPEEAETLRSLAPLLANQRTNARLYADIKDLLFGIIRALTSAIDAKDPYTSGHSERVARIAVRLGEQLGMSLNQRGDLYLMGLLHDIGKIGIEDGVLKKPEKLTPVEYRQIQSHVKIGVHILADLKKLHHLLPGVAHHHESMDGTGYPSGLAGEAIPLPARILAVADAFDAMSSSRPYRRRLHADQIDLIFEQGRGRQWDPKVIDALFACREDIDRIRSKGLGDSLRQVVGETLGRHESIV